MKEIDVLKPLNFLDMKISREISTDCLIIGTGISGLKAGLDISKEKKVMLITKNEMIETNTNYAQGGIAVVLSKDDNFELHINDTIYAGAGLCDRKAVEVLIKEGPERIQELLKINTQFDRKSNGELSMTREAAHSKSRILHAGDTTGAELERALSEAVRTNKNIEIREHNFLIELLDDNSVLIYDRIKKEFIKVNYNDLIFATGSIGRIYANTSNPEVATGDGIALAYRNNIELEDLEFVQFHPTTFYKKGVPRFLISESLRGEGGVLRNQNGERFMDKYHEKKELAPRDVVSRSILKEMKVQNIESVYLDMTDLDGEYLLKRFPSISKFCMDNGIDLTKDYIPVRPAAHYIMGGIKTDLNGVTSKNSIYAIGEVARTGVHGANRLASNSLMEGLVFGTRAAKDILKNKKNLKIKKEIISKKIDKVKITIEKVEKVKNKLKKIMWYNVGILRSKESLELAQKEINKLVEKIIEYKIPKEIIIEGMELLNMLTTGYLITEAALARKESKGAHYRLDYPPKEK